MGLLDKGLIAIATEFLKSITKRLDPFTSKKGEVIVESGSKVSLYTPDHIQWAKYGRGPGKRPPLDPILEWVKEKGIIYENQDQKGTAFAIMNAIGKNGTNNWVPNAPNAMDESINKDMNDYNKKTNDFLATTIHTEIDNALLDYLPNSDLEL